GRAGRSSCRLSCPPVLGEGGEGQNIPSVPSFLTSPRRQLGGGFSPSVASASPPLNFASQSAACQIVENRCQQKPNGSTANAIKAFVTKSRRSKHKPTRHASANRSIFVPSLITSDDSDSSAVIEIPRIEPLQSLGLDHNALQHLIGATFGSPSEARDLVGGPNHALMPRAPRGRIEPLDHFVLGQLCAH